MRRWPAWLAWPFLWLATALRFLRLDAQSFWNDEGNSARLAERSVRLIVEGAAGDVHPPLYYLLLAGWRALLGDGEFELRALSAFAGVLLVAAVVALGRMAGGRAGKVAAPVAGLLAAVHPALVYYSQEARMYALLGLWAALSTALLWRLLPWLGRRGGRALVGWAVGYLLAVVAGLYTHYFFPVVVAAQGVAVGVWFLLGDERRSDLQNHFTERSDLQNRFTGVGRWATLVAGAAALYLPWLPVFVRQTGGREGDSVAAGRFLRGAGRWLALGETAGNGLWVAVAAVWALALLGAVAWGGQRRGSGAAVVHVVLPPLAILLLSATRPAYYKFLIVAAPFVALLAAWGVAAGWQWARKWPQEARLVIGGGLAVLGALALWGSAQSLQKLYFDPAFARADYRGMAAQIVTEGHPNAGVILNAANQWEVFTYYHRDGAPVYPIPRGQPDEARIGAELAQIAAQHERLYALFWGEAERDPQRLVERWLDAHAFKAREEWVGDVRFVTYAVPPQPVDEMAVEADVQFGEAITLLGYTLQGGGEAGVAAGDILQVTLFWRASEPLAQRYKVFLHLTAGDGPPLAQRDAEPVGNLAPTTTWQPGETVVDNHGLLIPAELPAGAYTIRVGLYLLEDAAARLAVHGAEDGDSFSLGTVTVR